MHMIEDKTHSLLIFCKPCGLTGYIVFSGVRRARGVQGLRVIIQSDRPPQYVDDRVEAFLHHMEVSIHYTCGRLISHRLVYTHTFHKSYIETCTVMHFIWIFYVQVAQNIQG